MDYTVLLKLSKSICKKFPRNPNRSIVDHEKTKAKKTFRNQTIGVNTLASIIPNIAKEAGWDTTKLWSGQSLRASAITTLYAHGFDKNSVKKFSGHRLDFAVREYQRSEKRKRQTSEILSRPAKEARATIQREDIIEEDEELVLAMSQIVEKDGLESDLTIEYEMSQIDIANTFSFTGAVFNNCTINFK